MLAFVFQEIGKLDYSVLYLTFILGSIHNIVSSRQCVIFSVFFVLLFKFSFIYIVFIACTLIQISFTENLR